MSALRLPCRRQSAVKPSTPLHGSTRRRAAPAVLAIALLLPRASQLVAQEDFRSVDLDRPIRVEDAYPVKFREWEAELGGRGSLQEGGGAIDGLAELKTGLFLNGQVGLEVEYGWQDSRTATVSGLEGAVAHLLYNFNRETWSSPAFAVRVDVHGPGTGDLGRENWGVGLKGIATRSLDRLRLHANAGYSMASRTDGGDLWRAGLAFDYPIGLFSRSVMADLYVEAPADAGRTRVWLEAGTRWQVTNVSVLDFGLTTRLDEWDRGIANIGVTVGLSRIFGLSRLISVPPYPNPRID